MQTPLRGGGRICARRCWFCHWGLVLQQGCDNRPPVRKAGAVLLASAPLPGPVEQQPARASCCSQSGLDYGARVFACSMAAKSVPVQGKSTTVLHLSRYGAVLLCLVHAKQQLYLLQLIAWFFCKCSNSSVWCKQPVLPECKVKAVALVHYF